MKLIEVTVECGSKTDRIAWVQPEERELMLDAIDRVIRRKDFISIEMRAYSVTAEEWDSDFKPEYVSRFAL